MTEENASLTTAVDQRGVATITLCRQAVANALDESSLNALSECLVRLERDDTVRIIVLTGSGKHFCSGLDVAWMGEFAKSKHGDDLRRLGALLWQIRMSRKPTIARLNGDAAGAGLALGLSCDIQVAADSAQFSLPAVRLGAVPAVIAPFIIEAVGVPTARRYLLTGETFSAEDARRLGFIQACCIAPHLDETVGGIIDNLLKGGPKALAATKIFVNTNGTAALTRNLLSEAAAESAIVRRSDEAKEGHDAFLEKRKPDWL